MSLDSDFDRRYNILDVPTPRHVLMAGRYKQSFAYYTLKERLPITLTNIIDTLTQDKDELAETYGDEVREEIKTLIGRISKLKYQLQTDKPLEIFTGDEPDKEVWNNFIAKLPKEKSSFFQVCWLYAECYMYRRVSSFVETTNLLKGYDYFSKQKKNALAISTPSMEAVGTRTRNLEKSDLIFKLLLKLNLWGNRCDLSITSGKEVKPNINPFEHVEELNPNVLIDNTQAIWDCLNGAKTENPVRVEIICDNAGYELFTDFIIGEYLIDKGLATKVRYNVKTIPWFISDVTPTDFHYTLEYLKTHSSPGLRVLGEKWTHLLETGQFELAPPEHFWTSPYEYYRMHDINPELYDTLSKAQLIIFKGDLNYRKLVGDFSWDETDEFDQCLRGFHLSNICTLRTVKADLICGLPEGLAEKLKKKNPIWMITGEYGVIQFSKKGICDCDS